MIFSYINHIINNKTLRLIQIYIYEISYNVLGFNELPHYEEIQQQYKFLMHQTLLFSHYFCGSCFGVIGF